MKCKKSKIFDHPKTLKNSKGFWCTEKRSFSRESKGFFGNKKSVTQISQFFRNRIFQKKAQFFTIAAILLLSISLISFTYLSYDRQTSQARNVQTRVVSMNWFIQDVYTDVDNALFISGKRALIALSQEIRDNDDYISDPEFIFKELVINGTIAGSPSQFLENSTIINWTNKVAFIANDSGIIFNLSDYNVTINQSEPWYLDVRLTAKMIVMDTKGVSFWNTTLDKTIKLSVEDTEDPVYTRESHGNILRMIRRTSIDGFVDYSDPLNPDVSNLMLFIQDKEYRHSNSSPSFLMRLQGDLSHSECCGIESIVGVDELIPYPQFLFERSHVDYIYWEDPENPQTPGSPDHDFWYINYTSATPETYVRIDNKSGHLLEYDVHVEGMFLENI